MTFTYLLNFLVPLICWSYPGFVTYMLATNNVDHFDYKFKHFGRTPEQEERYQRNLIVKHIILIVLCGPIAWAYLLIVTLAPAFKDVCKTIKERFWSVNQTT
jgi:hypothetical protein